jgi:hypothetical protein
MIRTLIIIAAGVWLAACGSGEPVDYSSPEDAAVQNRMSYTAAPFDLPSERRESACPETMPTGGITGSPHEVAGPLFCDY